MVYPFRSSSLPVSHDKLMLFSSSGHLRVSRNQIRLDFGRKKQVQNETSGTFDGIMLPQKKKGVLTVLT